MKEENQSNFYKYITPDPIDKLNKPQEKLFNIWSFLAGFMMAGGVWLWWWVIRVLIIN